MELIETEPKEPALVEPEPRYRPLVPEKNEHGQAWLRLALSILAAIVLIVLIVLLARWVYHKTHNKVQPVTPVTQQYPAGSSANNTPGVQPGTGGGTSPQTSNNSSNSSAANPNGTGTNPAITNTGPGNVAALFVGTSLAAGGLHYIISLRRFNKSGI